ncbi:hypothetical protein ACGYJ8_15435 [Sulfitobacter sp. 1A12126]|uniref:hypothetical protein n=1 Tax=Sulfitobacter sp. 1A12126 TaxID=3368591 RepID=UPI0037458602
MAAFIIDPWCGEAHAYADQVFEDDRPTESAILGPDGRPLQYEPRRRVGFDLRPSKPRKVD